MIIIIASPTGRITLRKTNLRTGGLRYQQGSVKANSGSLCFPPGRMWGLGGGSGGGGGSYDGGDRYYFMINSACPEGSMVPFVQSANVSPSHHLSVER